VIRTKDHSVISEIRKIFYETAYTTMGIWGHLWSIWVSSLGENSEYSYLPVTSLEPTEGETLFDLNTIREYLLKNPSINYYAYK
jgi:glycyl-tRNA synthetase alpha subunit